MSTKKKLDDSYDAAEEDEEIDAFSEESEDEDDDGKSKKRKYKSPSKTTVKKDPPIAKLPYTDRMFIIYNKDQQNDMDENRHIISLPHPKTNTFTRFILDTANNQILEINNFNQKPCSWFINDSIRHDGSLYLCTPFDSLFFIISYMDKLNSDESKFTDMVTIQRDPIFSSLFQKGYKWNEEEFSLICNLKMIGNVQYYRLCDVKLIQWLRCKVSLLAKYLEKTDTDIYRSSTIIKTNNNNNQNWSLMAIDFFNEYLNDRIITKLNQSFGTSLKSTNSNNNNNNTDNLIKGVDPLNYNPGNLEFKIGAPATSSSTIKKAAPKPKPIIAPKHNSKISDFFTKK